MSCDIKSHMIKSEVMSRGISYGPGYSDAFCCSDCKEVIFIIRDGIKFVPEYFLSELRISLNKEKKN